MDFIVMLKYTEYFLLMLWLYGSVTLGKSPSSFESNSLFWEEGIMKSPVPPPLQ